MSFHSVVILSIAFSREYSLLAAAPISSSLGMRAEWQGVQKQNKVVVGDISIKGCGYRYEEGWTTMANTGADDFLWAQYIPSRPPNDRTGANKTKGPEEST